MAMIQEFDRTGNLFFKYRSYIPLALYVASLPFIFFDEEDFFFFREAWWGAACFGISAIGMIIRALTIGYTPRGTSGRNADKQIAESINTKGMYSLVRHPLYLGNFLMWLGLIIYAGSLEFLILAIAFFWFYYERIMFAEEQFVRNRFGVEFDEWASKTPPFFPRLHGWKSPELPFAFRNVLKREYHGFFASIISFCFLNVIKHIAYNTGDWIDIEWIYALAAGATIYVTIRIIVKTTKLLNVGGR